MASAISQKTVDELTGFLNNFVTNNQPNRPIVSNLSYDTAKEKFYNNMKERGLASETFKYYNNHLSTFAKYLALIKKKNALEEVVEDEIKHYLTTRYSKHNPYTQNCHIRAIRAFFNYLERDGYILANPVTHLKLVHQKKEKIDYLSTEQIRKVLTSFDLRIRSEIRNLLIVMVLLDTGARISELISIKIEDINFAYRSIYIYATKTNTFRTVYYSIETERILNVYRKEVLRSREKGLLFLKFHAYLDIPLDEKLPKERVESMLRIKGQKIFGKGFRMNPHKFRHTFATHFIINGGDPFSLKDLLGHSNIETTNIYVDMSRKDLKTKHDKHSIFANMEKTSGGPHEE
jgi:integrase/recombinase XerD